MRFIAETKGNVAIMTAAFMGVAVGAAALAVDLGMLYVQRRAVQGAVDLAAIAAAGDLANAEAAARATLGANGVERYSALSVVKGRYHADPYLEPDERFVPGQTPYNAAKVDLTLPGELYFAKSFASQLVDIGVSGLASAEGEATFSLGSGLVSVNGGLANALLAGLLGGSVALDAVHYDGLVSADVQLLDFLGALATQVGVSTGTYRDVLEANTTLGDVLTAMANVTSANGDAVANAAIESLLASGGNAMSLTVPLSSAINLGTFADVAIDKPSPGLDAAIGVMDVLTNSIVLANGERQLEIDLGASVPGVANLKLYLVAGERMQTSPWVSVGQAGSVLRTAQFRLRLVAKVLGSGVLSSMSIHLPVYLELANSEAELVGVSCPAGDESAEVAVTPGVAEAWLGIPDANWTDLSQDPVVGKANVIDTPLITVLGFAHVDVGSIEQSLLEFDMEDVEAGTKKRAYSRHLVTSLLSTLLQNATLDVRIAGLSLLSPSSVQNAVVSALTPATAALDSSLSTILGTLGVQLGIADVRMNGIRCKPAALYG